MYNKIINCDFASLYPSGPSNYLNIMIRSSRLNKIKKILEIKST